MSNRDNHVALWHWLASTCSECKQEWPGFAAWEDRGESFNGCFACLEAEARRDTYEAEKPGEGKYYPICHWCPLDWGSGNNCTCSTTPFCDWIKAHTLRDVEDIKAAATKIRDMKWRDE